MKKVYDMLGKLLDIDAVLGVICLTILICITFVGTISRYVFNYPIVGQDEVQNWMIVWAVFFGGSYVFRRGSHVAIDVLVALFPQKIQACLEWFSFICTAGVLIFIFSNSLTLNMQFFQRNRSTPILSIPNYVIFGMVTVGSIWMLISYAYRLIGKYYFDIKEDENPPKEGGEIA